MRTKRISILVLGCLLGGIPSAHATAVLSNGSGGGNWSNASTWTPWTPTATDDVTILSGDVVVVDISTAEAAMVNVLGTLKFSRSVSAALSQNNGNFVIQPGGTLDMGTQADPIPNGLTSTLNLSLGTTPGQWGMTVNDGGTLVAWGGGTNNIVIRSSGTNTSDNTAYLRNLVQNTTSFVVYNATLRYLGTNAVSKYGVTFDGPNVKGSISNSTVLFGYKGLVLEGCSQVMLNNNIIQNSVEDGIYLHQASSNTLISDMVSLSGGSGIFLSNNCHGNTLLSNTANDNTLYGIELDANSQSNSLTGNILYSNLLSGIGFSASSGGNYLTRNIIYGNAGHAIYSQQSMGNTLAGDALGYDTGGSSSPEGNKEIAFDPVSVSSLKLFGVRVNTPEVDLTGMAQPASFILSYSQSMDTGSVRIWGDYLVSASTLTLDYAAMLYNAWANPAEMMSGNSISLVQVISNDANAVSQRISITYNAGNWDVSGSVSGAMGSYPVLSNTNVPAGSPQFQLTVTASSPQDGDRADFVLNGASQDQNVQKKLLFGPSDPSFNHGRSRLIINPGAGLGLAGIPGTPTLMDRINASATYYTVVDQGTFWMMQSSVTNTDEQGIQLSNASFVFMSSSTFDLAGEGLSSTNTYVTASNLTSSATFYGLVFNNSRSSGTYQYNILVAGTDTGLSWHIQSYSGARSGEPFDYDPNNRVIWAGAPGPPAAPVVLAVPYPDTIVLAWGAVGATNGYSAEASTAASFNGTIISSATSLSGATQLNIQGLQSNTIYYSRVGALWGSPLYANTVPSSTSTLANYVSGISVANVSASSITVTWNPFPSAPPDQAAEGFLLQASTVSNFSGMVRSAMTLNGLATQLTVDGLWPNTTFYLRVGSLNWNLAPNFSFAGSSMTASVGGSGPTQVVDLQAVPGVSTGSIKLMWTAPTAAGGASAYGYIIKYSSSGPVNEVSWPLAIDIQSAPVFVTPPVPSTPGVSEALLLPSGWVIGQTYWFALKSRDTSAMMSLVSNSPSATPGGGAGGGLGTGTVSPGSVANGSPATTQVVYTVPGVGTLPGGMLEIKFPQGIWPSPQYDNPGMDGYVEINPPVAGVSLSSPSWDVVRVNINTTLGSGSQIYVVFNNIHYPCALTAQNNVVWEVKSAPRPFDVLAALATQPSQNLVTGPARWIDFADWSFNTLVASVASPAIGIRSVDNCWKPVNVTSNVFVALSGYYWNGSSNVSDPGVGFASDSNFSSPIAGVTISSGSGSASFYYKTSTIGDQVYLQGDYTLPNDSAKNFRRYFKILDHGISFSGLGVDTGTRLPGQTQVTMTPDGDGIDDVAFIRFLPSDLSLNWHVVIKDGSSNTVFERWGSGDPQSNVNWDGTTFLWTGTMWANAVVPNGTYTVQIEVPGLALDTSLSIVVQTSNFSGKVTLNSVNLQGARVEARGTNTPGSKSALTAADGTYTVWGARSGYRYNLVAQYDNPTTHRRLEKTLFDVTASASGQNIDLSEPALIRINASIPSPAPQAIYGSAMARTTDYRTNYWGSLHFAAGATTSDNGDSFNSSTWTILYADPGTYALRLEVPGYGVPAEETITVASGDILDKVYALTPKASIFGKVTLPGVSANGIWVSIEGIKSPNTYPTVWGGVWINSGADNGIFSMYGVDAGTYKFRARVQDYAPLTSGDVVVTTTNLGDPSIGGGVDFSGFTKGSRITGTLKIVGNTSGFANLNLWVNAWSPQIQLNAQTQVALTPDANETSQSYEISGLVDGTYQVWPPWLDGFELDPPGPKTVQVQSNSGTLDLTLRELSGKIQGSVSIGGGSQYTDVHVSLQGPTSRERDLISGPGYTLGQLASGFYSLIATDQHSGATYSKNIPVINGQTTALDIDLSQPTRSISGTVSVQSAFTMNDANNNPVTINTITDLLANAVNQTIRIGGNYLSGCTGGTPTSVTTARVEAFPKTFDSFNNTTRTGFSNCFPIGGFKSGVINVDGTYTITGLTPGVWEVSVYRFLDNGTIPNVAVTQQTLVVKDQNIMGISFGLTSGYNVGGRVSLPAGVTDHRQLNVQILDPRGESVQQTLFEIGSANSFANSLDYTLKNLANGKYALQISDTLTYQSGVGNIPKYVAKPVSFEVQGGPLTNVNVQMSNASRIVGKLVLKGTNPDGTPSQTLITANNLTLLPDNFNIAAQANPWVEGAYYTAQRDMSGTNKIDLDDNNQWHIEGLQAGAYDLSFKQDSYMMSMQGQGNLSVASMVLAQKQVGLGQTLDIGTIELTPGVSATGTVSDQSGNRLPNVKVRAQPATTGKGNSAWEESIEAYTDALGQFTLTGLSPARRIYHITAAPRDKGLNNGSQYVGVPYGSVTKFAVDVTQAPSLDFVLPPARSILTGRIQTVDGGLLSYPGDSSHSNYPAAAIFMKLEGSISVDENPMGDVEEATDLAGNFNINNLVAGIYDITLMSLNYRPVKLTKTLSGVLDLGTITLQRGPSLKLTLTKPDGSAVNTSDVNMAVAATPTMDSILFGQVNSDANTKNISEIDFSGFELNKTYMVLLFDANDNTVIPAETRSIRFSLDNEDMTRAALYQPSQPIMTAGVKKIGSSVEVKCFFSSTLRNQENDQDATQFVTRVTGQGTITNQTVSTDRHFLTFTYTPPEGEQSAQIQVAAYTIDSDAVTGGNIQLKRTLTLRFGQKAWEEKKINPLIGGSLNLSNADDKSRVVFQQNTFKDANGNDYSPDNDVTVEFYATEDYAPTSTGSGVGRRAPMVKSLEARGPEAYISEAYLAMRSAQASTAINPLSSFYSVLLPAGVSHQLKQSANLVLNYDTNADPNKINIYYFDGTRYYIENDGKTIDTINHTITVNVSHMSTFVVLERDTPLITTDGDASNGADIEVFNFPNPFDLQSKTKTLSKASSGAASMTTEGTIIRYSFPLAKAGAVEIKIFDIVGELVRTLDLGSPAADQYHYVAWDGRNASGNKVASGVYIGELKVGSEKRFFKMAVIK